MVGNDIVAVSDSPVCPNPCFGECNCPIPSTRATSFEADGTAPSIESYSLSMDGDGLINVTFTEAVQNPRGRTALRGLLPNRVNHQVITRWKLDESQTPILRVGKPMIEVIMIRDQNRE